MQSVQDFRIWASSRKRRVADEVYTVIHRGGNGAADEEIGQTFRRSRPEISGFAGILAGKCGSSAFPFLGSIAAGWPSPAEEELLDTISFDDWLIEDSSFMVKVQSDAMQDAGIHTGDVVIFRRGQKPKSGDIVIAEVDSEWLMRYYMVEDGKPILYPANGLVAPIYPEDLTIIGVIRSVIRKY